MRCGDALPPESVVETRHGPNVGVTIHARSLYQGPKENGEHLFGYRIDVSNTGKLPVQLMTRHWLFANASGHLSEVKGPGAGSKLIRIEPNERWDYSSSVGIFTTSGAMHGSFQFEVLPGEPEMLAVPLPSPPFFSARVGRLSLSLESRQERVPCRDDAEAMGLLPTTSVWSTGRLIIGAMVRYVPAQSEPDASSYVFQFTLTIHNGRRESTVLASRSIETLDARGHVYTSEVDGVGGGNSGRGRVQLGPGAALQYQGSFTLPTKTGNLAGSFGLISDPNQVEGAPTEQALIGPTGVSVDGEPVPRLEPNAFLS